MDQEFEKFEGAVKTKYQFGWTPRYEEEINTSLKGKLFTGVVLKTFEKLDWTLVFYNDESAEAKRESSQGEQTEKISITYQFGRVIVRSTSLRNDFLDWGRNSKRVKVFIYAFQKMSQELTAEELSALEIEREREDTMSDYVIPETLPLPISVRTPNFPVVILGGLATSLLLGFLIALPSAHGFYIIGLFEIVAGFIFGFVLKQLIRNSNYTKFENLSYLVIVMVLLTCVSSQYFQFRILTTDYSNISFSQFMKLRWEAGLTIRTLDTGTIGLIVSWIIQFGLIYLVGIQRLGAALIEFSLERVPQPVIDFALYHFLQNKTEDGVRKELAKKGWKDERDQTYVMEAIAAIQSAREINRS